jgi:hypothetical protein
LRWSHSGSALLLLCAACVVIAPSCYRVEISLERPGGAAGAAGQGSEVGEAGSAGAPDGAGIGSACDSDRECGDAPGLRCLRASSDADPLGSPAKGLCTAECSADQDCQRLGAGLVCGSFAEPPLSDGVAPADAKRWCLLGCSVGEPSGAAKCRGRAEMACRPFARADAIQCSTELCPNGEACFRGWCRTLACGPRCNVDGDCPSELYCNAQTGLCDAAQKQAVPVGKTCSKGSTSECGEGVCVEAMQDGLVLEHICSQSCTLGSSCAEGTGACIVSRFPDHADGDAGYCAKTCECDDDCSADARCYPWKAPDLTARYKSAGFCEPLQGSMTSLECP